MTTQSNIGSALTGLEAWGMNALAGGEKLLLGIATKFGGAQFNAIVDAAKAYKAALVAGKSPTDAWNSAYAVLGADESAAIAEADLGFADAIIELLGNAPV